MEDWVDVNKELPTNPLYEGCKFKVKLITGITCRTYFEKGQWKLNWYNRHLIVTHWLRPKIIA